MMRQTRYLFLIGEARSRLHTTQSEQKYSSSTYLYLRSSDHIPHSSDISLLIIIINPLCISWVQIASEEFSPPFTFFYLSSSIEKERSSSSSGTHGVSATLHDQQHTNINLHQQEQTLLALNWKGCCNKRGVIFEICKIYLTKMEILKCC